jgi:hypothetical protein
MSVAAVKTGGAPSTHSPAQAKSPKANLNQMFSAIVDKNGATSAAAFASAHAAPVLSPVPKKGAAAASAAGILSPVKSKVNINSVDDLDGDGTSSAFALPAASETETHRTPTPPPADDPKKASKRPLDTSDDSDDDTASTSTSSSSTATAAAASSSAAAPPTPTAMPAAAAPSAPKYDGVMGTPCDYHYAEFFDRNFKPNGEPNSKITKLFKKGINTIVLTPEFHGDIDEARRTQAKADPNGFVPIKRRKVDGTSSSRVYQSHPAPNPHGVNRLFPVSGDQVIPMTGAELKTHIEAYKAVRKVHHTSFAGYLSSIKFKPATK